MQLASMLSLLLVALPAAPAGRAQVNAAPGFLVVAPDRGFLGNEETRDAFEAFATDRKAALVFVTDERTRASLDTAVRSLTGAGTRQVVVLPFFLSRSDPRFLRAEALLGEAAASSLSLTWARPFGESYLAVEALADRLRGVPNASGRRLVVVGAGAKDQDSRERMTSDWQRLADLAAAGLGFESVRVVLEASQGQVSQVLAEAVRGGDRPVIVPFHLGSKLDSMMSFSSLVRGAAPEGSEVVDGDVTPDSAVGLWLAREANRHAPLRAEDVGVVVLAHGSDYHWNDTMLQAVAPLAKRYKVEPAFSMADPPIIERAVRRLEARGARHIVILRVFGLADSFKDTVERLVGLDVEEGRVPADPAASAHDHGHGHGSSRPALRLRTAAVVTTVGGLEDHPLFARALLDRASSVSREPSRETVILVAHGEGDDARDARWREVLESLAARMRALGGHRFRAIRTGTWREDWPEKRKPAAEAIRSFVQDAASNGGRALVLPARTLGQGPEKRLLDGLSFELGEGFAPHPLFARWAEEQVAAALVPTSVGGVARAEMSNTVRRGPAALGEP